MTDHSPQSPPTFENPTTLNMGAIWKALFGLIIIVVASMWLMWSFLRALGYSSNRVQPADAPTSAQFPPAKTPLNPHQVQQRLNYEHAQQQLLNSYGWADEKAQIARIPIERAMELFVQQQGSRP